MLELSKISNDHQKEVKSINALSEQSDWLKVIAYILSWQLAQKLNKLFKFALTDVYGDFFRSLSYNTGKFLHWVFKEEVHADLFQGLNFSDHSVTLADQISTDDVLTKLYWIGYKKYNKSVTDTVKFLGNDVIPFQLSVENFKKYIGIDEKGKGDNIEKILLGLTGINTRLGKVDLSTIADNSGKIAEKVAELHKMVNEAITEKEKEIKAGKESAIKKLMEKGLTRKHAEIAIAA